MSAKIEFNCILQEGVIADELRSKLAAELVRISLEVMGAEADDVDVSFRDVKNGYGFRGGEISTTSVVRSTIPPGGGQEKRVEFMQCICDMWMEMTGCGVDELVVSARDRSI